MTRVDHTPVCVWKASLEVVQIVQMSMNARLARMTATQTPSAKISLDRITVAACRVTLETELIAAKELYVSQNTCFLDMSPERT